MRLPPILLAALPAAHAACDPAPWTSGAGDRRGRVAGINGRRASLARAAVLGLAAAACAGERGPVVPEPMRLEAAAFTTGDTIGAVIPGVSVRASRGTSPAAGVTVRLRSAGEASVAFVAGGRPPDSLITVVTDGAGRAAAAVRLGDRAGTGVVLASIDEVAAVDSVRLTISPGAFWKVRASDTVVTAGTSFRLHGTAVDRAGNPRTDSLDYAAWEGDSVLTVRRDGSATALRTGRALFWATPSGRLGPTTQAWLTAVPAGTLAVAWDSGGILIGPTDGAGSRTVATKTLNSLREPAWSPDGSRLAVMMGDLGILDLAVADFQPLDQGWLTSVHWPAWSPDGAWIYFQGDEGRGSRLYRVHPNGTGSQRVMDDSAAMPAFSPDGTTLAYVGSGGLRLLDLRTGVTRPAPQPAGDLSPRTPRWSPDGRVIAFVTRDGRLGLSPLDGVPVRVLAGSFGEGVCWLDSRWIAAMPPRLPIPYVVPVQLGPAGALQLVDTRSGDVLTVPALRGMTPSCKPS